MRAFRAGVEPIFLAERFENTGCDMDTGQEPATKSRMWKRGMRHDISAVCCREKLLLYSASHHWKLPTWKAHRYNLTFHPSMSSRGWNYSRSDMDLYAACRSSLRVEGDEGCRHTHDRNNPETLQRGQVTLSECSLGSWPRMDVPVHTSTLSLIVRKKNNYIYIYKFPWKCFKISHKPSYDDSTLTLIILPSPQLKHHYNLLHHLHCSKTNRMQTLKIKLKVKSWR